MYLAFWNLEVKSKNKSAMARNLKPNKKWSSFRLICNMMGGTDAIISWTANKQ